MLSANEGYLPQGYPSQGGYLPQGVYQQAYQPQGQQVYGLPPAAGAPPPYNICK